MKPLRYFSTFTGIGGAELGIRYAYNDALIDGDKKITRTSVRNHLRGEPVCVGYSEIDPYATKIYATHFPNHTNYGDITNINAEELPDFDLLVGGFPCQAFSIAGKRLGFEDIRGTLFFDLARILRAKQPRLFVFENVKGLLSHDGGKTFATIIATLTELGYDLQWQVLNSKNHGVPQNRERIYIVGYLRGTPRPQVFPFTDTNKEDPRNVGEDLSYTIDANYGKGTNTLEKGRRQLVQLNNPKHSNDRVYAPEGLSPTLNTMQGGRRQPFVLQKARGKNKGGAKAIAPTLTGKSYQDNNHVFMRETKDGFHMARNDKKKSSVQGTHVTFPEGQVHCLNTNHIPKVSKTIRAGGRKSPHGSKQNWDSYDIEGSIRRLTPTECERLQGFPDGWTQTVSDTQRYKTLGNAMTVNVVRDVIRQLL